MVYFISNIQDVNVKYFFVLSECAGNAGKSFTRFVYSHGYTGVLTGAVTVVPFVENSTLTHA
jgi:hypothetical protein